MHSQIQVELQEHMGSDSSIANAGWTSTYNKDKRDGKYDDPTKVKEFVRRLIIDGHSVPIESVLFRFWIRMPIFTDRQHMTHRIASHNGLSGRYRTMPNDFYNLPKDCRDVLGRMQDQGFGDGISSYETVCREAYRLYNIELAGMKEAERKGVISNAEYKRVREVLRGMLPTSGMVERTTIMNLRSFANYVRLRTSEHAQPEIREVAEKMLEQVEKANICPVAIETLKEVGWRI